MIFIFLLPEPCASNVEVTGQTAAHRGVCQKSTITDRLKNDIYVYTEVILYDSYTNLFVLADLERLRLSLLIQNKNIRLDFKF